MCVHLPGEWRRPGALQMVGTDGVSSMHTLLLPALSLSLEPMATDSFLLVWPGLVPFFSGTLLSSPCSHKVPPSIQSSAPRLRWNHVFPVVSPKLGRENVWALGLWICSKDSILWEAVPRLHLDVWSHLTLLALVTLLRMSHFITEEKRKGESPLNGC